MHVAAETATPERGNASTSSDGRKLEDHIQKVLHKQWCSHTIKEMNWHKIDLLHMLTAGWAFVEAQSSAEGARGGCQLLGVAALPDATTHGNLPAPASQSR